MTGGQETHQHGPAISAALAAFVAAHKTEEAAASPQDDRDGRALRHSQAKAAGLEAQLPPQLMNRLDVWGGGLRRMVDGGVGPRREDEHYHAPRYVPIGFARYESPVLDPGDYAFYQLAAWRVAVPRSSAGPAARALLRRIYEHGPASAGYARVGDTLVPAILGSGDRRTLAGIKRHGWV